MLLGGIGAPLIAPAEGPGQRDGEVEPKTNTSVSPHARLIGQSRLGGFGKKFVLVHPDQAVIHVVHHLD
jgi:hypothetical protein